MIVLPAPARRGHIGIVQRVFGWITGGKCEPSPLLVRHQQHGVQLQHRGDLVGRCPQQVIERTDPGQLAAEGVEFGRRLGAGPGRHDLPPRRRRQVADDDGDQGKEE